jgi:ketosteroid isomerase-like protein
MNQVGTPTPEQIVERYFAYIRDLRKGDEAAADRLIELWDEDGAFEFAGAPPVTGTFKGRNAIHVLYKNRAKAAGMPLKLEGGAASLTGEAAAAREAALGVVDTQVHRMRSLGATRAGSPAERMAVGWTTLIGTEDNRGFQVSGNHTFTFKDGKIISLKVVVSPKPDRAPKLALDGLSVDDIGRLSLAAWAVV